MKPSIIFLLFTLLTVSLHPQSNSTRNTSPTSNKVDTITNADIYQKLIQELNPQPIQTEIWLITDSQLVYDIYKKFQNDISDEKKESDISNYLKNIYNRSAYIRIEKEEMKNNIFSMTFLPGANSNKCFYSVTDPSLMRSVLGEEAYNAILSKNYPLSDIGKIKSNENKPRSYDIKLNLLHPELMLYSFEKSDFISLEGHWGENLIVNPGWFSPDYVLGAKWEHFNYMDSNFTQKINKANLYIRAGISFRKSPLTSGNLPGNPLRMSGNSLFISIGGVLPNNSKVMDVDISNIEMCFTGKFNFTRFNVWNYQLQVPQDIYTNRNYLSFTFTKYTANPVAYFGNFKWGGGISFYDIHHIEVNPFVNNIIDLDKDKANIKKYNTNLLINFGIEKKSDVFQHDFNICFNFEPSNKYGYIGFLFNFLIDDTFGFDLRFYRTITGKWNLPDWRSDEYFVFSPTIRISY